MNTRLPALDALRGIAIILVAFGHFVPGRLITGAAALPFYPFAIGGVLMFFLLSGFLIEQELARDANLLRYAIRRFMKVVPAYVVCIGAIALLDRVTHAVPSYSLYDVLMNAAMVQDLVPDRPMSGLYWPILIGVKFYIVAPFVMLAGRRALRWAPFVLMAVNLAVYARRSEISHIVTFLTFCFVGMQFGPWYRRELGSASLAAAVVLSAALYFFLAVYAPVGAAIFTVADAALLAYALRKPFAVPALAAVAVVSYSWFLYHAPFGYPLLDWLTPRLPGLPPVAAAVAIAVTTVATLALACIAFMLVERRTVLLGRRIEGWIGLPAEGAALQPKKT